MRNVETIRDQNKAKLTALAQLIALYAEAKGITATQELARLTGYSDRAIRKAKTELECRNPGAAPGTPVPEPECRPEPRCRQTRNSGADAEPQCRNPGAVPSRVEYNNKLTTLEDIPVSSEVSEVGAKSQKPPKRKASPRGARLQPDWELPDAWRQWTQVNFAHASADLVATEADKFRDYWIAKSGQQAAKLDWEATWRNWCRTAFAGRPSSAPINTGRMAWDEKKAASHARARELAAKYAGAVQ